MLILWGMYIRTKFMLRILILTHLNLPNFRLPRTWQYAEGSQEQVYTRRLHLPRLKFECLPELQTIPATSLFITKASCIVWWCVAVRATSGPFLYPCSKMRKGNKDNFPSALHILEPTKQGAFYVFNKLCSVPQFSLSKAHMKTKHIKLITC
jgi:hypothetical protein